MAQCQPLLTRLLATSVAASSKAGQIIRDIFARGELGIVDKGVDDIQTEADRSAQNCIIESLSRQFPNITLIGEEGSSRCEVPPDWIVTDVEQRILNLKLPSHLENVPPEDICVWVDPLDGTREFAQGLLEHITVLIGIAVRSNAVAGVIHQPYYKNPQQTSLGRTIWALEGVGLCGLKAVLPPIGRRIITITRSHSSQTLLDALDAVKPDEILHVGGAGHKVILLLEGKAHAYIVASQGCKRWDTCGPEVLLRAAGGMLTDLQGQKYSYDAKTNHSNTKGVLATAPGEKHRWYLSSIPEEIKRRI